MVQNRSIRRSFRCSPQSYVVSASTLSAALLMETEGRYQSFPHYRNPGAPRRFEVVLTFRRAPTDGGEGEGAEQPSAVAANGPRDVTVMTVQVGARDTVDTLNRRIRVGDFLLRLDLVVFADDSEHSSCTDRRHVAS
jgi:hypothetical protein